MTQDNSLSYFSVIYITSNRVVNTVTSFLTVEHIGAVRIESCLESGWKCEAITVNDLTDLGGR